MKLLVLTPGVFDKGGISRYGRFQIEALRRAFGDDAVAVLSLMGRQRDDLEIPFDVTWAGPVPLGRLSRAHFSLAALELALARRPDAIVAATVNFGPLGWILSRLAGGRLVTNIYGRELWSGLTSPRAAALKNADLVISDCHNTADRAVALGLVRRRPEVVWDCVDLERYSPGPADADVLARYGIPRGERFRLLFLARLHAGQRYKGTERFLRLLGSLPGERFEGVMAGKGDDVAHLEGLARSLGVSDRVRFPGSIREEDMPAVYRSADAFFLVSEAGPGMGEGIPLTPLEAMACGVPVLVGDQDGSRETLDGEGGLVSGPEDRPRQAAYLRSLADDPGYHRREREAARSRAESAFGFEPFARKTVDAVRGIAKIRADAGIPEGRAR